MKRYWPELVFGVAVAGGAHAAPDNADAEAMMKKDGCAAWNEIDKKVMGRARRSSGSMVLYKRQTPIWLVLACHARIIMGHLPLPRVIERFGTTP